VEEVDHQGYLEDLAEVAMGAELGSLPRRQVVARLVVRWVVDLVQEVGLFQVAAPREAGLLFLQELV